VFPHELLLRVSNCPQESAEVDFAGRLSELGNKYYNLWVRRSEEL
jgi:hypothetical protein